MEQQSTPRQKLAEIMVGFLQRNEGSRVSVELVQGLAVLIEKQLLPLITKENKDG